MPSPQDSVNCCSPTAISTSPLITELLFRLKIYTLQSAPDRIKEKSNRRRYTVQKYDKIDKLMNEMLGIDLPDIPDLFTPVVDMAGSVTPVLGSLWTSFKIHRLKQRLDIVEPKLQEIKDKIERKENENFYKLEVFPLIIKQIYEEDEDSKIPIIINGFEYTVEQAVEEMEKIYHYFDVLEELRVSDIIRLFDNYVPGYRRPQTVNNGPFVETPELRKEVHERNTLNKYMDHKLERLGLIYVEEEELVKYLADPNNRFRSRGRPRTVLTAFGKKFVEFFKEE